MKPHLPLALATLNLAWTAGLFIESGARLPASGREHFMCSQASDSNSIPAIATGSALTGLSAPNVAAQNHGSIADSLDRSHPALDRFHWNKIESSDYRTYMANLRGIGCPEETIRDIITADLRSLLLHKYQSTTNSPIPADVSLSTKQLAALEAEERGVLDALEIQTPAWAGTIWRSGQGEPLEVSPSKIKNAEIASRVHDIVLKREMLLASIEERELQASEVSALKELDTEREAILANSLTAEEREEFDLQYSPAALSLRDSLNGIELTAEEFRSLYEVRQKFDAALEAGMHHPDAVNLRSFEEETERILGPERFADFQRGISVDDSSAPE